MTSTITFRLRDLKLDAITSGVLVRAWLVPPAGEDRLPILRSNEDPIPPADQAWNGSVASTAPVHEEFGANGEATLDLIRTGNITPDGWTYTIEIIGTHNRRPVKGVFTNIKVPDSNQPFWMLLRQFEPGAVPDFVVLTQGEVNQLIGAGLNLPVPDDVTIEQTGGTPNTWSVKDGSATDGVSRDKLRHDLRDRIDDSAVDIEILGDPPTIRVIDHLSRPGTALALPTQRSEESVRDIVGQEMIDPAKQTDISVSYGGAPDRDLTFDVLPHTGREFRFTIDTTGRHSINRSYATGGALPSVTPAARFVFSDSVNSDTHEFSWADVLAHAPVDPNDPLSASNSLEIVLRSSNTIHYYLARGTDGQWHVGMGTAGLSITVTVEATGSLLEPFARVTEASELVPVQRIGDQATRLATTPARPATARLLQADGTWVDPPAVDPDAITNASRRLAVLVPDRLPNTAETASYATGDIVNYRGRLYELLSADTTNLNVESGIFANRFWQDTGAAGQPWYDGDANFLVSEEDTGPNPVIFRLRSGQVAGSPPASLYLKAHNDHGYYWEDELFHVSRLDDAGGTYFAYSGGDIRAREGTNFGFVDGVHYTLSVFNVSGGGPAGPRTIRGAVRKWVLDDRDLTGAADWAVANNSKPIPLTKFPATVARLSQIEAFALTAQGDRIPQVKLAAGSATDGYVATARGAEVRWEAAAATIQASSLLALFSPTAQQRGYALGVSRTSETALALIDVSGRAGRIDPNPLRADQAVAMTGAGTWTSWTAIVTVPGIIAAQVGFNIISAEIRATCPTGTTSGGDRIYVETRIVRQRGTGSTVLSSHTAYIRNVQDTVSVSGASKVGDEEILAADDSRLNDIYRLEVRCQQQIDTTRSITFRAAVTSGALADRHPGCHLDIVRLGGIQGPPGTPGARGPAGPGGLASVTLANNSGLTGDGTSGSGLAVVRQIPAGGNTNQVLARTASGYAWANDNAGQTPSQIRALARGVIDTDVPTYLQSLNITGQGGNLLRVNSAANGLEFYTPRTAGTFPSTDQTAINSLISGWIGNTANTSPRFVPAIGTAPARSVLHLDSGRGIRWGTQGPTEAEVLTAIQATRTADDRDKLVGISGTDEDEFALYDRPTAPTPLNDFPSTPMIGDQVELLDEDAAVSNPAYLTPGTGNNFVGWFGSVGTISGLDSAGPRGELPGVDAVYYGTDSSNVFTYQRLIVVRSSDQSLANAPTVLTIQPVINGAAVAASVHQLTQIPELPHLYRSVVIAIPPLVAGTPVGVNVTLAGSPATLARPPRKFAAGAYVWDGILWHTSVAAASALRDRLETLHGDDRLDAAAIKNFPTSEFEQSLHSGPAQGLSITTPSGNRAYPSLRPFGDQEEGENDDGRILNIADVNRGEIQVSATLHLGTRSASTIQLRIGSRGTSAVSHRQADLIFRSQLPTADFNASDLGATAVRIARVWQVWDGGTRLGGFSLYLAKNSSNQVGYYLAYVGEAGTSQNFSVALDLNVAWAPTDGDVPTARQRVQVRAEGDPWAIAGGDGVGGNPASWPTRTWGGAPVTSENYGVGNNNEINEIQFVRQPGVTTQVAPHGTLARVDLPEDPPDGVLGYWVESQTKIAQANGSFSGREWRKVHATFVPWGMAGFDRDFRTTPGGNYITRAILKLNARAATNGALFEGAMVGIESAVFQQRGQTYISIHALAGTPKPPNRVAADAADAQGVSSGGFAAVYRIVIKPAEITARLVDV